MPDQSADVHEYIVALKWTHCKTAHKLRGQKELLRFLSDYSGFKDLVKITIKKVQK